MEKNKKTILIITLVLVAVGAFIAFMFAYDWYRYSSQNHKIKSYIESLQGVDKEAISSDNYCTYSHQKYSNGVLGCSVVYTFSTTGVELDFENSELMNKLGWKYKFDNTDSVNKYSEEKYSRHVVFGFNNLTCSYSIFKTKNTKYELECSGSAKRAWFPVREV